MKRPTRPLGFCEYGFPWLIPLLTFLLGFGVAIYLSELKGNAVPTSFEPSDLECDLQGNCRGR